MSKKSIIKKALKSSKEYWGVGGPGAFNIASMVKDAASGAVSGAKGAIKNRKGIHGANDPAAYLVEYPLAGTLGAIVGASNKVKSGISNRRGMMKDLMKPIKFQRNPNATKKSSVTIGNPKR